MKWEPLPDEPVGPSPTQSVPDRIIESVTHGFHGFCLHDIHATHLGVFLVLCSAVLVARWWTLSRADTGQNTLRKKQE
jgi:hypothetical protein